MSGGGIMEAAVLDMLADGRERTAADLITGLPRMLRERLDLDRDRVLKALARLRVAGRVSFRGVGGSSSGPGWWSLPPQPSSGV